jgi:hypothetical protein
MMNGNGKPMKTPLSLLTALLLAPLTALDAEDFHVDIRRGDDANPGSLAQPLKTISKAAALARAGDTVRIATGVYREAVCLEQPGTAELPVRFEAELPAQVVVTGADRLTEWRKEPSDSGENLYSADWPHRFIRWTKTGTHPGDDYHQLIGRAEQVFVNGYPHCGMPRIARRLGSVCQDTGRPRSDHAVCRTMAQRCSAPAPVVEGVAHQTATKNGLFPAPRRVTRRRHRPLPVSNLSFPYR